jgi:hypothetical protein
VTQRERITTWIAGVLLIVGVIGGVVWILMFRPTEPFIITGVVLARDSDPRNQTPIANADVTATTASGSASGTSDISGLYRITLPPRARREQIALNFRHPGYRPLQLTARGDLIVVARMASSAPVMTAKQKKVENVIANQRIRYSVKSTTTTNIGTLVDPFEVTNRANVPCKNLPPCSPDNQWKASISSHSLDAGEGNEYRNVRLSCIAGPCPFTSIESENQSENGRVLKVTVRDWSDTVTFLLEAEVTQTRMGDVTRQSYPAIFGSTMSFTLPSGAEGPSIEAELNGTDIIFPMGPDLILSWANCTMKESADQGQLYRCELKAGYRFK